MVSRLLVFALALGIGVLSPMSPSGSYSPADASKVQKKKKSASQRRKRNGRRWRLPGGRRRGASRSHRRKNGASSRLARTVKASVPRTKKAEAKTESERKALEHIERALGAEVPDGHTLSLSFDPLHFQLDRGNPIFRDIVVVKARLLSPDRRGRMRVRNWTRGDLNASYIVTMGDAGCRTSCTKSATKLAKVTRTVEEVIPIQEIGRSTGGGLVGAVGSVLLWAQGKGPIFEAAGPIGLGASIGVIVYGAKALQTRRVERRKAMRETVEWVRSEVRDGRYPHVSTIYSTYSEKAEDAGVHPKAFRAWLIELSIADLGADQAPKSDRTPQKSDS